MSAVEDMPDLDPTRVASLPFGRLSLWAMINYQLFGLCNLLRNLLKEEMNFEERKSWKLAALASGKPEEASDIPGFTEDDQKRIGANLSIATLECVQLELDAVAHRVSLFQKKIRGRMSVEDVVAELRALRETFEGELKQRYFYRYPQSKVRIVREVEQDWAQIISAFKSAKVEAIAAADCYAIGHATASIFHLMRIAEIGLRALARERRVKLPKKQVLEWADWHTVIDGIKKESDKIAIKKRGPKRDAALEFYRGALGSFEGFKDAYRNNVMHARKCYIDVDAIKVMRHVHDFMNRLAEKTDETGKRITWGV